MVANIALHETISRIVFDGGQIFQVPRVSQPIEVDYLCFRLADDHADEGRPDESSAAGN
jgi:hypothetical protein